MGEYPQGRWNESFELSVTYHAQLFDTVQLDMYDSYLLLPDKHVGRAEIRLRQLEGMPESFTSYYEIWDKKLSTGASSHVSRKKTMASNVGALQAKISYRYQSPVEDHFDTTTPTDSQLAQEFNEHLKDQRNRESSDIKFCKYEEPLDTLSNGSQDFPDDSDSEIGTRSLSMSRKRANSIQIQDPPPDDPVNGITNASLMDTLSSWFANTPMDPAAPRTAHTTANATARSMPTISEAKDLVNTIDVLSEEEEKLNSFPILDAIGSWTVNKETNQVLRTIGKMLVAFDVVRENVLIEKQGQGFELSHMQILAGFTVLEKYYTELPRDRTWDLVEDLSEIEEASHFWKYSLASYGWKGLNFIGKGNGYISDAVRAHSDALSILEFLSLPKEDLLAYEFRPAEAFRPSYYVARDRETNSIVLCIRGTMSAFDTLTDLVCEYVPWKGGLVHKGMKSSAMWFFRNVAPQLVAYTNEHSTSALYIVGHSLGAATAAILTIMLLDFIDEFQKGKSEKFILKGFGYAPACALSLDLSERYKEHFQSFVFADDFVSKLSYGSMMDVKELIIAGAEAAQNLSVSQLFWSGGIEGEAWRKAFNQISECRKRCLESLSNPRLYVAGTIYQFWLDPIPGNDTRIVMERTDARRVSSELIIRRSILLDHLPTNFDLAFRRAREALSMPDISHPGLEKSSKEDKTMKEQMVDYIETVGLKRTTERGGGEAHMLSPEDTR
ncbi:hypothetical protein EC973_007567 [Apophysomyces ossiformis]|uniref:sn-1-specific diacylglycerol lipase n=1 Tax=Apophysomyces ossiformis TaxID=679940 RepID=A0A8H7BUU8_9FUNG|nr:hypothetical protein EC973_007567 [Apophysomyces ossiformis]